MTESDHVLVGIFHVNLPHTPVLILRTVNHFCSKSFDSLIVIVHILHEDREPCSGLTLIAEAKEDFDLSQPDGPERWRFSPIPKPVEKKLLRIIFHRLFEIADVKNGY